MLERRSRTWIAAQQVARHAERVRVRSALEERKRDVGTSQGSNTLVRARSRLKVGERAVPVACCAARVAQVVQRQRVYWPACSRVKRSRLREIVTCLLPAASLQTRSAAVAPRCRVARRGLDGARPGGVSRIQVAASSKRSGEQLLQVVTCPCADGRAAQRQSDGRNHATTLEKGA